MHELAHVFAAHLTTLQALANENENKMLSVRHNSSVLHLLVCSIRNRYGKFLLLYLFIAALCVYYFYNDIYEWLYEKL